MNKFNELYDVNALKESYEKAKENNKEFAEVPLGKYVCKVEKIELGATKSNVPMGKIQFRIIEGDYEKQCLFYNQVLVGTDKTTGEPTAFGIKIFDDFLNSLEPTFEVAFSKLKGGFEEYADVLLDVAEDVEKLVYEIQYGKNGDFNTFKVVGVYDN